MGLANHKLILFASDVRYVQGLQKGGADAPAIAIELAKLIERYCCELETPETTRLKQLLRELTKSLEGAGQGSRKCGKGVPDDAR